MSTHIALLRAVNVGGNLLPMLRLRALCAELGLRNIQTYIQSGNLLFTSALPAAQLIAALEQKLAGQSRLPIAILLRTASQWSALIAANPFLQDKSVDPARLYVTFLTTPPTKSALQALHAYNPGTDSFHLHHTEIYLHCPHGYGRSRLAINTLEKLLHQKATTRNWNTLLKLQTMASTQPLIPEN